MWAPVSMHFDAVRWFYIREQNITNTHLCFAFCARQTIENVGIANTLSHFLSSVAYVHFCDAGAVCDWFRGFFAFLWVGEKLWILQGGRGWRRQMVWCSFSWRLGDHRVAYIHAHMHACVHA